ncbi:MAG: serine/threonine protein kinase [Myxococcales bacterium]|nr:serine/threonine protein kinase [Myxococcales bacterium]
MSTGTLLDGMYELKEELGRGASGTVYRAVSRRIQQEVAVKLLHDGNQILAHRDRLWREFQALYQLAAECAHLVRVLDFNDGTGPSCRQAFLVMEYLVGETVQSALRRANNTATPLTIPLIVDVFYQTGLAIRVAHSRGILHRDLKPENLFLTRGGSQPIFTKVLDFGLAKTLGEDPTRLSLPNMFVGTPAYASPESARALPLNGQSDIYSLGCVVYELLCGHPPFLSRDAYGLLDEHVNAQPTDIMKHRPDCPRYLGELVMAMLEKRPSDRPDGMTPILDALVNKQWLSQTPWDFPTIQTKRLAGPRPPALFPDAGRHLQQSDHAEPLTTIQTPIGVIGSSESIHVAPILPYDQTKMAETHPSTQSRTPTMPAPLAGELVKIRKQQIPRASKPDPTDAELNPSHETVDEVILPNRTRLISAAAGIIVVLFGTILWIWTFGSGTSGTSGSDQQKPGLDVAPAEQTIHEGSSVFLSQPDLFAGTEQISKTESTLNNTLEPTSQSEAVADDTQPLSWIPPDAPLLTPNPQGESSKSVAKTESTPYRKTPSERRTKPKSVTVAASNTEISEMATELERSACKEWYVGISAKVDTGNCLSARQVYQSKVNQCAKTKWKGIADTLLSRGCNAR